MARKAAPKVDENPPVRAEEEPEESFSALEGGPGEELPPEEGGEESGEGAEPELVDVQIGSRTIKMSPEDAEAYEEERQKWSRPAPQAPQAPVAPKAEADPLDGLDEELFRDPKSAVRKITGAVETKLRTEYQQEKAREVFWRDFFQENPDLRDVSGLVDSVVAAHAAEIGPLPITAARKRIAELTRKEVVRIAKVGQKGNSSKLETPNRGRVPPVRQPTQGDEKPGSLIASLKARQARRRQAATAAVKEQ